MIKEILDKYPDLLTTTDLVKIGLYPTHIAAYFARKRKISSPPFHQVGTRVFYPKDELLRFIEEGGGIGTINKGKGPGSWQGGALKGTPKWDKKRSEKCESTD